MSIQNSGFGSTGLARQSLATDTHAMDALRAQAAKDPKSVIKQAAKQFEALFMQEVVKSMRASTLNSGMLENSGTQLGTELLDAQLSAQLTGMPTGLSDAIARQLERKLGPDTASPAPKQVALPALAQKNAIGKVQNFIQQVQAGARSAQEQTGIPASFMIAQAAHESGWGKREILNADGSSSNNIFGIKAGANWTGPVAQVKTTEYIDGKAQKVVARFRAYSSYEEAFKDYAKLMTDNARYKDVVANASTPEKFAQGLQKAGYATDPAYAEKLTRVINTTLRVQRAMV